MPRPSITAEKRAEMRSLIRDATVRIARRRNIAPNMPGAWGKITIRDVIKEADISIGTFYKYFEDRADLAQTLWTIPVDRLRSDMQEAYDEASGPVEKVRALLQHYANFALEDPNLFSHIFLTVVGSRYRERGVANLDDEPFYRNLRAAFEDGQANGVFREFDTHEMAQTFWAAIHGSLALPVNLDRFRFDQTEALAERMIDTLMDLITLDLGTS